ncbi:hypothetical protein M3Y98_00824800 [Aphelenchoides besseyi]|nr:hypothetical protein M3Y98_00824800 [Aphelenchoides besseyi]
MNTKNGYSSATSTLLLDSIRSSAKTTLFNDLDEQEGVKMIIWESSVMKHVDLLIPYNEFTNHNVKSHRVLPDKPSEDLRAYPIDGIQHVYYVIPPIKKFFVKVMECLAVKLTARPKVHVRVLTRIPKSLHEFFVEDTRVRQRQPSLEAWPFFWLPAFGDFLLNNFASVTPARLLVSDDFELFFLCAAALNDVFTARRIYWRGEWAKQVVQNLQTLKPTPQSSNCIFDSLIVVDRILDPISPLLQQFSFAGVLDSMFGISIKGVVEVHEEVLKQVLPLAEAKEGKLEKIALTSEIYTQIVHSSIGDALKVVRKYLRELADIETAHGQLTSINDFKQYMPSLQKLVKSKAVASQAFRLCSICFCYCAQSEHRKQLECERDILSGHFNQSTMIDYVEELILNAESEDDGSRAIRLIVLQSLVNGGLTLKLWNEYQKLLVQSFGPVAVTWCLNLQQISGLVQISGTQQTRFAHVSTDIKRLKAVIENEQDPSAAYFNGYVSLLVRILERGQREVWKGFETYANSQLKNLPAINVDVPTTTADARVRTGASKRTALFVIGGLTRAEIACLRAQPNPFAAIFTTQILKPQDMIDFRVTN